MQFKIYIPFLLALSASLCYASTSTYDGKPGCKTPGEIGRLYRNFWDPMRYWRCYSLNTEALSESCPDLTGFQQSLGRCVPWRIWKWEIPVYPPSCPTGVMCIHMESTPSALYPQPLYPQAPPQALVPTVPFPQQQPHFIGPLPPQSYLPSQSSPILNPTQEFVPLQSPEIEYPSYPLIPPQSSPISHPSLPPQTFVPPQSPQILSPPYVLVPAQILNPSQSAQPSQSPQILNPSYPLIPSLPQYPGGPIG
uniref:Uncharacterized protein n=1 Tax=Zeugodacus cucurbitae TaxID=28588 RepID=A0A0A1X2Z8_ZEUCU